MGLETLAIFFRDVFRARELLISLFSSFLAFCSRCVTLYGVTTRTGLLRDDGRPPGDLRSVCKLWGGLGTLLLPLTMQSLRTYSQNSPTTTPLSHPYHHSILCVNWREGLGTHLLLLQHRTVDTLTTSTPLIHFYSLASTAYPLLGMEGVC